MAYVADINNLIPAMTSDTTPNGIASASAVYTGAYGPQSAYLAFDHSTTTLGDGRSNAWGCASGTCWLAYEFTTPKLINGYNLNPNGRSSQSPKSWTFQAWNGSTWVTLDTQSNITSWVSDTTKIFPVTTSTEYAKYRINITQSNDSYTFIGEMEITGMSPQYSYAI